MLTYHNDPKLKKSIVAEMENHRKHDQFIKGTYGKMNGHFKGCSVGCAIDSFNIKLKKDYKDYGNHKIFEEAIGVPEWLAKLQETIFEGLPEKENSLFAVNLLKAIPVGKSLDIVKWKFCAFILKENIERVSILKISDELKKQVVDAIRGVLVLHEESIKNGMSAAGASAWSAAGASAWSAAGASAWSAAGAAARSAAGAASWAAAGAASWAVAGSAAGAASYKRYAVELIKLLKEL